MEVIFCLVLIRHFATLPPLPGRAMTYTTLLLDLQDGIATITINRPEKLNALNAAVIEELGLAAERVASDPAVKGSILIGAGPKAFVAGADISELVGQTPIEGQRRSMKGQQVFRRWERCGKPVIAAVNGFALGGGCELALACHLRIASESARFGQPEVKLGIGPGYGGTVRLPRLIGKGRALEMLLTGRTIRAEEALQIGLVNKVVPEAELLSTATEVLKQILANGPLAVSACLELVETGLDLSVDEAFRQEAHLFGLLSATTDMGEGMAAFLEKRAANFTGQ